MKFNLSDNGLHLTFAPMSLTRPIGDIRMGLFTNKERYQMYLPDAEIGFLTEHIYQKNLIVFIVDNLNANVIPNEDLIAAIGNLENNQSLILEDYIIASYGDGNEKVKFIGEKPVILMERWNIFQFNQLVLKQDFMAYVNKISQELSSTNTLIGNPSDLFIEKEHSLKEQYSIPTKVPFTSGEMLK